MEKVSKGVEYILRCAIAKGGSVGYNDDSAVSVPSVAV